MKKYFTKEKLLSFNIEKQFRALYDLAHFIEKTTETTNTSHFEKLSEYHSHLKISTDETMQKLNKEFAKIKKLDYQFQVYIMNLERFLGQSKKDYDFIVRRQDSNTLKESKLSKSLICLLDSIRSAHNVGSFFRNAECFGVKKLFLCGLTPTPKLDQVRKTSMGCTDNIDWEYYRSATEIANKLKSEGYKIWAIETAKNANHIHEILKVDENTVLIFGHEQFGISLELLEVADKVIDICLYGKKNSLNVSVSQAIILSHLSNLPLK